MRFPKFACRSLAPERKMSATVPLKRLRVRSRKSPANLRRGDVPHQGGSVMSAFTYLFRGRETAASPEHMQQTMEKWVAWFKELGAQGHHKDPGHPLESTGKVVKGTQKMINDGPYAEAKDVVGGYMLIEARDLAQAAEIAQGCPILEAGGSVEVRPIQRLNM